VSGQSFTINGGNADVLATSSVALSVCADGDGEMERWRDGEMERWRDGKMDRWRDGEMDR
jgi:hypothetical protein